MTNRPLVIAIDGPTASGKGTLAKKLARHYGFAHLDTGSLYRAVAYRVMEAQGALNDPAAAIGQARRLDLTGIDEGALRSEAVGSGASIVAAIQEVRDALLAFQRQFASAPPGGAAGAVLDGRDIGTVICPEATVKLFVTASAQARARRRTLELTGRGLPADEAHILADINARDHRDSTRTIAPLKPAPDAHLLDTTGLDIEAAFAAARAIIDHVLG